jgi:CRISPR system Cascade subunit CasE
VYLSKLLLDVRSKQARADLASPYQLHATLCRAFADQDQTPPRFLWRTEEGKNPVVLVQSADEPDWGKLAQRFPGYFRELPKTGQLPLEHLRPAQILRFRLKCNPTITTLAKDGSGKKKRYGLHKLEDLIGFETAEGGWKPGWLERQAQKSGFTPMGFMVAQSEKLTLYKHDRSSKITLQSVLYEGHLKITDLEAFKQTLRDGLGHAKALGFGLLSIAKT